MSAISSIAGVQARIGTIEQRLGIARPTSVATSATATNATVAGTRTATRASSNSPIDVTGSFESVAASIETALAGWTTSASTSNAPITGTTTSGRVDPSTPYAQLFEQAGAQWGIDAKVLAGVAYVESRFQTDVVSSAGAVGMMQFLPSTAASMGVDPRDPASAIDGAARYLRTQIDRFGSIEMALAAYNVGPGAIANAGSIEPGSQAERYVDAVLAATERV
jgi:soluble lytic murein transglycosylase-like protein